MMVSSSDRYTNYDPWAWLYNQSEAYLSLQGVLPILEKLLLPYVPEKGQILDLCCGTGQVAQQLILKRYQVTGLDSSEKMLHHARENAPQGTFILADACFFEVPPTFDAVVSTDSSLNHIMSLEELKQVFRNVYNSLKSNGLFLFDLGLEDRYRNIQIDNGELQQNYAWTVGETYDREHETGTFTITLFQPTQQVSNKETDTNLVNMNSSIQHLKCFIYNRVLRLLRPSLLKHFINRDWQPSSMTFPVKPYTKIDIQAALEAVGFMKVSIYDFRGKISAATNTQYAYFVAHKSKDASLTEL
jgi:SAM-dependent methyltransferase